MKIFVEQLEFVGRHGVYEEERREGRRFQVDLEVDTRNDEAQRTDALDKTVDYRGLAEIIVAVGHHESFKLIERLAEEILARVFDAFDDIDRAEITIRKFASGVPGSPAAVGVTLERRSDRNDPT
ncbi:MAG: dihydroneopterin aldolase [Myxococcota bacterium]